MTSVWLHILSGKCFWPRIYCWVEKRWKNAFYDYEIAFFSWIETNFFLVIILCQITFSEVSLAKVDRFTLNSKVFFWELKMFQKSYKTLELQGTLEFSTTPSRFINQNILRLNISVFIPNILVLFSMDISFYLVPLKNYIKLFIHLNGWVT